MLHFGLKKTSVHGGDRDIGPETPHRNSSSELVAKGTQILVQKPAERNMARIQCLNSTFRKWNFSMLQFFNVLHVQGVLDGFSSSRNLPDTVTVCNSKALQSGIAKGTAPDWQSP